MMKRIINFIELFVLVVIPEFTVAKPPSGLAPTYSDEKKMNLSIQSQSTGTTKYESARLASNCYEDPTEFDYSLITANGDNVLENKGRNTDIVFFFDTKLQIYAKGDVNVLYTLEFEFPERATVIANRFIATSAERYKECQGSHTYKIDLLYESTRSPETFHSYDMVKKWCIFKERKTNVTTFMIKWTGPVNAGQQDPIGIFRSADCRLKPMPGADNKLELSVFLEGQALGPKYILETSTPNELEEFLI